MRIALPLGLAALGVSIAAAAYFHTTPVDGIEKGAAASRPSREPSESSAERRAIHALGRLEPTGTVLNVAAPTGNEGSRLESLLVREGNRVKAGTLLGTLDTHSRQAAAVEQERSRLSTALARLSQVKAGNKSGEIESARAAVKSAEHELATRERDRDRSERLKQNNAISDADLDKARFAQERAQALLRQAQAQLEAISEVRTVDVAVAEADVELARSSLALAQANLDATRLIAPSDGTILRIHTRPGEQISSSGVLEMGQIDRMQAVAEVFEGDVAGVAIGDRAVTTIDSMGHVVQGRVAEIGFIVARKATLTNDPVSDTDARVVEVRIDLVDTSMEWLSRLSNARVQVTITAAGEPQPRSNLTTGDAALAGPALR
jgi:HlyD family secretion protein